MNNSVVTAKNLSKWYDDVIGLNSLNIDLPSGVTGIVGPNGAGKSTLFKLATGMIKPNKGTISVMGEDPWMNHDLMKRIGFCPDYDNLSDYSTGRRSLHHLGSLHGLRNEELKRRVEKTSKDVGAQDFLDKKIDSYSQGMRQRLKLAGSLLHDPDLLFLDEPLSGADPQARKDLIELIQNLHEEKGHDVLVSSHVLSEIERMTTEIALLYKGRVIASGDISEVRGLIDKHPHNIVIDGTKKNELAKLLLDLDYVVSVGFEDNRRKLVVEVEKPDDFFQQIASLINQTETEVFEMYSRDDNLQAVFDYLIGGKR
ncbi:MAG: ABC transporter ATP-binding protein [Candidatus Thermoplasmatota archaeon]